MSKKHKVIIIPGLGDYVGLITLATNHWRRHNLEPFIYSMEWKTQKTELKTKLEELSDLIERTAQNDDRISLVGCSAGGSVAINAFFEQKDRVHRVINVCGRLRTGEQLGFRSLDSRSKTSPAFKSSVRLSDVNLAKLSKKDCEKLMTVRALFGDELVPSDTAVIEGAHNISVPTGGHVLSIGVALTIFSRPLISFLNQE